MNTAIELSVSDDLPDLEGVVLDKEAGILAPYLKQTILAIMEGTNDDQSGTLQAGEHGQTGAKGPVPPGPGEAAQGLLPPEGVGGLQGLHRARRLRPG